MFNAFSLVKVLTCCYPFDLCWLIHVTLAALHDVLSAVVYGVVGDGKVNPFTFMMHDMLIGLFDLVWRSELIA